MMPNYQEKFKQGWSTIPAYQRCRDDGQDLLQNSNEKYVEKYKDGRTYWVSFFRRTRISWSTGKFMIEF
jgi:hypothetical protein